MAEQVEIELTSWDRFHTRNLTVTPELLGRSHSFTLDGREITTTLPRVEWPQADPPTEHFEGRRVSVSSWQRAKDGKLHIEGVYVENVDVEVSIPGRSHIPQKALTIPPKHPELFTEQQTECLDLLVAEYGDVARRAFDLWIRTVRWKADDWRIGLPEMNGAETGWATYIRQKGTENRIWSSGHIIMVHGSKIVTTAIWDEVSATLTAGESPPVFYDLLYDALAHLERGDLQRTVLDAAVAAETFMKTVVQDNLPDGLSDQLKKYISEANVRRVIDRLLPEHLDTQQRETYTALKSSLHDLFNDRNSIMHSGRAQDLSEQRCKLLMESVRILLSLVPLKSA
jgi:hypothetical protein